MSERMLKERELLEIARTIESISRQTGFERRNRIGRVLFEQVFAQDANACATATGARQLSFRRLAELLHGKISKSELQRSLNVYLVCTQLSFVPTSGHLTVSHVDAVAGLAAPEQERLLRAAEAQGLSVRQLRQLRRNCNDSTPAKEIVSLARRAARRGRRTSEALALLLRSFRRDSSSLPSGDVAELMRCVETLEGACALVRQSIGARNVGGSRAA